MFFKITISFSIDVMRLFSMSEALHSLLAVTDNR
jgi:hypothetical protein